MKIQQILEVRRLELFFALQTFFFGLWLLFPFNSMGTLAYNTLISAVEEPLWGWLFFFNGLSHIFALSINGRRWWSPFVRWFSALCSFLIYLGFSVGFFLENWMTTAVPVYFSLALGSAICMYFAWRDAKTVLGVRHYVSSYS